ncbi:MAG: hypothetical protein AB7O04_02255 [Hyphomonadaceae bacterium]
MVLFVRVFLFAFLIPFLLGACAREAPARCDLSASSAIAFTAADAEDAVEARAIGAHCTAAVAVLIVRAQDGFPIWAWAAPFHPTFGGSFAPSGETNSPTEEEMRAFLERWAQPDISTTSSAPPWSEALATAIDRATYEDIRARNTPMLCHLSGVARQTCVYWESAAASAGALYERDAPQAP